MTGYTGMMVAGILVLIFKLTNAFGLSARYPGETLFLVGGSLVLTPILFYIATIRNSKKFFNSNPNFYNNVQYSFDEERIAFEAYDGNTGTCKWQNTKAIEEDERFIRIVLQDDSAFLFVKEKIEPLILVAFQLLLNKVKSRSTAHEHLS